MAIHYLEIVTADVEATCAALEKVHAVRFGKPVAELGQARTATLRGGGEIGVRAPLRPDEAPVVRPYALVDDLDAALEAVTASGGTIALGATPMAGRGRFAIYVQGGVDYGLWQK
ncbi:MAG: hydroxylase [Planctomycetes bacterium]|nr:hydroxylase [Planctomycetota bacterium]